MGGWERGERGKTDRRGSVFAMGGVGLSILARLCGRRMLNSTLCVVNWWMEIVASEDFIIIYDYEQLSLLYRESASHSATLWLTMADVTFQESCQVGGLAEIGP